jgi:hypothetical protein
MLSQFNGGKIKRKTPIKFNINQNLCEFHLQQLKDSNKIQY